MKYSYVVNFTKCTPGSITASNRIATWLSQRTGFNLIDTKETADIALGASDKIDKLILVNGMFAFCDFRGQVVDLAQRAEQIIWIGNDYAIKVPSQLKKALAGRNNILVAQYSHNEKDLFSDYYLLDLNKLTYNPHQKPRPVQYEGLMYYGAYRESRAAMFQKYFAPNDHYQVFISTSTKNIPAFKDHNPNIRFMQNMPNLVATIGQFQGTVYIHDDMPDGMEVTPANRFYECLSAGTLIMFDVATKPTFDKAGIDVTPWLVDSPERVGILLGRHDRLLKIQQTELRKRNYLDELNKELTEILTKITFLPR